MKKTQSNTIKRIFCCLNLFTRNIFIAMTLEKKKIFRMERNEKPISKF